MSEQFPIEPREGLVVIEQVDHEEQTDAGLYLPQQVQSGFWRGRVLRKGPGGYLDNGGRVGTEDLEEGALVILQAKGHEIPMRANGKQVYLLHQAQIVAIDKSEESKGVVSGRSGFEGPLPITQGREQKPDTTDGSGPG